MVSSAAPPAQEATLRWPTPVLCAVVAATPFSASLASHTPNPKSVTIAGSLQSELGCSGDWDPTCASTHLKFDPDDDAWQATFDVPAGNWEYKAAINGSWDENYGANAISNGANIHLDLAAPATVKFYYDHKTHWITSNQNSVIVTAPGSYQKALGCPGDWQPDCLRSLLEDPDGDGIYTFTAALPAGSYEVKATLNESWDVNYGAGGARNGANIPFTVGSDCQRTMFTYDSVSHVLTVKAETAPAQPISVTIAGSLQSELGCGGDWDPACAATHLAFDAADGVWQGTFSVPAGNWEYKAALNDSWTESYGDANGKNITLALAAPATVKFYYDHKTHWITSNRNAVIASAPGSYQAALGCPGNWQPDCLRSWLQDPEGDGTYLFSTTALPAGNYETKATINENWDENYGLDGVPRGSNIGFAVARSCSQMFFVYNSSTHVLTVSASGAPKGNLNKAQAQWIARDTIAWKIAPVAGETVALHYSATGSLAITKDAVSGKDGVSGGTDIQLTYDPAGLPPSVLTNYPQLAGYSAFKVPASADVAEALKSQLAVSAKDAGGELLDATSLQIPGALDDLYTYNGPLGATFSGLAPTLRLWAPTARSVKLRLYNDANPSTKATLIDLAPDALAPGVWKVTGDASWQGKYYAYEVNVFVRATGRVETNLVTDPYSVSLSRNSQRSHIVDLSSAALKPRGWDSQRKPSLDAPEDISLYELHLRDFSVNDTTVPAAWRGTFKAFTQLSSNGMRHLSALSFAGLTHVHVLPSFDIATINEDKSQWVSPVIPSAGPDSDQQQAAVMAVADKDGFNWGYDPWHYTVPEGSYSTNPDGSTRVVEFREMVQALGKVGLRTVMDVVYNHTNAAGQNDHSVLDRIVPGYYQRLNIDGNLETSSCCANTASEHNMMEKLLIDSVLTWAKQYKIDGFRFDLMGHHMKRNMVKLRQALDALTLATDGVEGKKIYLYGEAWNFGEVADNARGVNAIQRNMAGTGIGSFNDRIRDGARGGGPFSGIQEQGFLTGLYSDPNATNQGSQEDQKAKLLLETDWIRCGMAGGLASFQMVDRTGKTIACSELDYNGQKTGYTADPQEIINYIEAHDNETLFDALQLKLPTTLSMAQRVRVQNLGMSLLAFSQGVPFFHAGVELLRSKSGDRNSYNSGDWFNKLDFTYQANNWGVGLPPKADNEPNWPLLAPLLRDLPKASRSEILGSFTHMLEVLAIRRATPLLRLRTAADINAKVQLLNGGPDPVPGLIAMVVQDKDGSVDRQHDMVAVLINGTPVDKTFTASTLVGRKLKIHPIHLLSSDRVVKTSKFERASGKFTIPARTAVVFWSSRSEHEGEQEGDH
jgi:pullulanase-type alpha-1,6-glucosidase